MPQPVFLGHETALKICRAPGFSAVPRSSVTISRVPERAPARDDLRTALDELHGIVPRFRSDKPLDCLIGSRSHPRATGPFRFHACLHRLPANAFMQISEHLFVAVPPYAFLQQASVSDLVESYLLEYELCGTYAHAACGERTRYDIPPLTSAASLRSFAERHTQIRGARRALQALGYAADGSASPRETHMALSLGLPAVQGGEGLGIPLMNHEIALTPEARRLCGRRTLRCDLFWPQAKLDVEYQSRERHEGENSRISDSCRTNALLSMGYFVICVTNIELNRREAIEVIAQVIRKRLGKRQRTKLHDLPQRKTTLRRKLGLP